MLEVPSWGGTAVCLTALQRRGWTASARGPVHVLPLAAASADQQSVPELCCSSAVWAACRQNLPALAAPLRSSPAHCFTWYPYKPLPIQCLVQHRVDRLPAEPECPERLYGRVRRRQHPAGVRRRPAPGPLPLHRELCFQRAWLFVFAGVPFRCTASHRQAGPAA